MLILGALIAALLAAPAQGGGLKAPNAAAPLAVSRALRLAVGPTPRIEAFLARLPEAGEAQAGLPAKPLAALAAAHGILDRFSPEEIQRLSPEAVTDLTARIFDSMSVRGQAVRVEHYNKMFLYLENYLQEKRFHTALKALHFAKLYHTGTRKDGITPEFQHQLEIALYLSTLKGVRNEEEVLAMALLHDVMEDYGVSRARIRREFGPRIERGAWLLTKKYKGMKKAPEKYFPALAKDPSASLVKGADRVQNVESMVKVFPRRKQRKYAAEVREWFLPMIKQAKRNFLDQSPAYFNIKYRLEGLIEYVNALTRRS